MTFSMLDKPPSLSYIPPYCTFCIHIFDHTGGHKSIVCLPSSSLSHLSSARDLNLYFNLSSKSIFYMCVLICSKFLMTTRFASMKRSTQFCMQGSSLLSSFPDEILPVMHLRKQVSVREWMAV